MKERLRAAVVVLGLLAVAADPFAQEWRGGRAAVNVAVIVTSGNLPPATPVVTEPATDGQIVSPADVHMEQAAFSDPNPGDTHVCTDWEIQLKATAEAVWTSYCNAAQRTHVHLGDGVFVHSYAGRSELAYDTDYYLRVRDKDSSGDPTSEWSAWAQRLFRTSPVPAPGTSVAWTVRQSGYEVEAFAGGLQLPVNIAFVPSPGPNPSDPFFYVTELYGNVKVVARDGTITDFVRGVLNYQPSGVFPGSGEQGTTGILVDPVSGDVFVSMLYESSPGGPHYPKIVRFRSNHGGKLAGASTTILDMEGETQIESHQISNLSIGPDGKLYAHNGDGFVPATAQDLDSFRGKILRMNLDGSPPPDNPFYDPAAGRAARNYVFAYGFRNPFGGTWRAADGQHYAVENGPSVDRFAKIVAGRNYLFDGTDTSMRNYAIYNWSPAVAPVNVAFVESETFGGSGFPADKLDHAFVAESGPTYATGPQTKGKRITEFVVDASGNYVSGPTTLIEYTGTGKATVAGLTAGPDGLYFTELYADSGTSATDVGARVMRVKYVGTGTNVAPSVSITSPINGATFTAPASISINATASDSDGTVSKVDFYQDGNLLGTDTTSPYSFTWSNVAAGSYSLTAVATDDLNKTGTSTPISITVTPAGGSLPPPWVDQDIGSPSLAGSASYGAGAFTVNGAGVDIEGGSDQFHYVYQSLSGDVTVIARVASIQNTNPWAKGGVMIRETLAANSKHAMMVLTPGNGLAFQRRIATGGFTAHTPGAIVAAPYWVKLVRSGNTFSGYSSPDGVAWTLVGADSITMSAGIYVGLPLTSHNSTALCTATFDNVSATGAAANNPPSASITSPINGATFTAPASIPISATASDSDGTVSKVDFYQDGNLLGTDTTSPYSFTWSNVAAGSYSLTARATDNAGATTTSSAVSVTVSSSSATFSVAASPSTRNIKAGSAGQATYTVTITPSGGFTGSVNLTVTSVLPSGATASFSPSTVSITGGAASATMIVATSAATPAGRYTVTISGTSGSLTRTASVTLLLR